jgi:hypothetical protein
MLYIAVYKQLPLPRVVLPFELDSYFASFIHFIMRPSTVIQGLMLTASAYAVEPAAVYHGGYNSTNAIALRIGNGGAGQSGLIEGKPSPLNLL